MAIPDCQTLMLPVLKLADGEAISVEEAETRIAETFKLTKEERTRTLPGRRQRVLHSRVHWSKHFLMKAGLVSFPSHDHFVITEHGRRVLAGNPRHLQPNHFLRGSAGGRLHRPTLSFAPDSLACDDETNGCVTPELYVASAHRAHLAAVKAELLERIQRASPDFLERVVLSLLLAMGYGRARDHPARWLGRTFDDGVDGVIDEDVLGLDQLYVQAKRYHPNRVVTRPEVQAFAGSLLAHRANKGVFATTSSFSRHARTFADQTPQNIALIDGSRLAELMVEHAVGVKDARAIVFKQLDCQFFSNGARH